MNASPKSEKLPVAIAPAGGPATTDPAAAELTDCWNKIGVTGNATCPELAKFIHCRNCPVFSQAAARLLDRVPSADYQQFWTEHFAEPKKDATPGKLSLVIFRLEAEWLALPTQALQEVAESRVIHSLPHRRRGVVLGLANIRGELLICVSLEQLLGLEARVRKEKSRVIYDRLMVASWEGRRLAFPVDEVGGIHRCAPSDLKDAPATVRRATATYTRGVLAWRDKSIGCLDEELLFSTLNRNLT